MFLPSEQPTHGTFIIAIVTFIIITRWVTDRVEVWEEIDQRVYVRSLARALQQLVQQTFFFFFYS